MPLRLKFVVVPIGSAGDVQPLVWLGKVLQQGGHEVVVIAQEMCREMPQRAGLRTVAWGDAAEQEAIIRNPDLWHPRRAFNLLTQFVPKWAGESLPIIRAEVDEGRTVLVGGALAYGARVLSERWDVPLLTVHLQPAIFMSVDESPVMVARGEWIPHAPRWVRSGFFNFANWVADHKMAALESVRIAAGLPAGRIRGVMRQYWNSPDGVLCLFPEWYAHKAPDWPHQAVLTRFPLYDNGEDWADERLEQFLAAGDPPVVITPGSANAFGHRFIHEAVEACTRISRRAVVVTRFTELARDLPPTAALFEYVPFGKLFPRAVAVIHHGGIGTTAQCLAAGAPQLIMPLSHDQPDNASRIKHMGVGDYLYPAAFHADRIAERLTTLMQSPVVKSTCAAYRLQAARQMSPHQMADLIEMLGERALRVRAINGRGVPA